MSFFYVCYQINSERNYIRNKSVPVPPIAFGLRGARGMRSIVLAALMETLQTTTEQDLEWRARTGVASAQVMMMLVRKARE